MQPGSPISTPQERATRLRAYLACQQWALHRRWTQQQEDAWWMLDELDQVLDLIQRKNLMDDPEVQVVLERNGRRLRKNALATPTSPSTGL